MSTRTTYGYWHNRAVDGKQVCNHYARQIGGECGHPDLGVWTPLVLERDQAQGEAAAQGVQLREFGAWLTAEHAKLAHVGGPVARTYAKVLARYGQIEGSA
jgi:hypothetical protein